MLGKSARALATLAACSMLSACPHDVPQDSKTGADGKPKGAKTITLDQGEGKSVGIVTYPGGDRVDWKLVELPEKEHGDLEITLTWQPPRPGLQLAFDVFNEWFEPVVQSKGSKHSRGRLRTASIANAFGKYYIRVYAKNRGDAGKYKLVVDYKPTPTIVNFDATKFDIPPPPMLAALPEAPCDDTNFDPKFPPCKLFCPSPGVAGVPPGWPPCAGKCQTPDPNNPACRSTAGALPCPNPPDRAFASCTMKDFAPCNFAAPDPKNPKCDHHDPIMARVSNIQASEGGVTIEVPVGAAQGIDKSWRGEMLRDNGQPVDGGDLQIIHVATKSTLAKVKLTQDTVQSNPTVRFSPPK